MKKFIIYTFSFVLLMTGNSVFAQTSNLQNKNLTLEDCINLTLQNNPEIAASYSTQEAQRSQFKQSKSNYLPQVNGSAGYSRSNANTATGNRGTSDNYSAGINASQLIYDFGQTSSTPYSYLSYLGMFLFYIVLYFLDLLDNFVVLYRVDIHYLCYLFQLVCCLLLQIVDHYLLYM